MKFSRQQEEALSEIKVWFKNRDKAPFILNGYAGTGKSTIAKYISEILGIHMENVIYVSYTGKAALNLRNKGCDGATTVHKLLYTPVENNKKVMDDLSEAIKSLDEGDCYKYEANHLRRLHAIEKEIVDKLTFSKQPDWERVARSDIIVVDESSMINMEIARDLHDLGLPVIYFGDPFQIPPVEGRSPIQSYDANFVLTEVHRQALDSPIVRYATNLRKDKYFSQVEMESINGEEKFSIIRKSKATYPLYEMHDQVICSLNRNRHTINKWFHEKKISDCLVEETDNGGLGVNDKIVFLSNDDKKGIYNGHVGHVSSVMPSMNDKGEVEDDYLRIAGRLDDMEFSNYRVFTKNIYQSKPERHQGPSINLGWALTVHKSQGSEWDNVLFHYGYLRPDLYEGEHYMAKLVYTAITRAKKICTVVVPDPKCEAFA